MRHIIALVLAVSGCSSGPLPPPVDPNVVTNPTTEPALRHVGCDYNYSAPAEVSGSSPSLACYLDESAHSFTLVSTGGYNVVLKVPANLEQASSMLLDAPGVYLRVAGFPCSHWRGIVAWVPGDESWSIDVKAVCADDGTAVNALFNSLQ